MSNSCLLVVSQVGRVFVIFQWRITERLGAIGSRCASGTSLSIETGWGVVLGIRGCRCGAGLNKAIEYLCALCFDLERSLSSFLLLLLQRGQ